MTSGTSVFASQYVTIQDKAESLLGTGSTTRGYGQAVQSADVFIGNAITKAQWDLLRFDIINIKLHQDGVIPDVVQVNVGDAIGFGPGSPNTNYDILLEQAISNRFSLADSQSIVTAKATQTFSSPWSTQAQTTLTCNFADATTARHFFNSGGKIRITSTLAAGAATSQVNAWVNFLNSVGTRSFGAGTNPTVNYYTLTNSYQIFYQDSLSSPYSANNYRLEAKTDVANNSAGTATQVQIRITLSDTYVDPGPEPSPPPGDSVVGTLTVNVAEVKASGLIYTPTVPSSFTITSPSYSLSSIVAS
jgi:hypothetical protein